MSRQLLGMRLRNRGENFPHPVRGRAYDYVTKGKDDGYRSYHVVFDFQSRDHEAAFDGRRVEVQVRTWLQHSWATAVEAVGLFRRENLKGGDRLLKAWRAPAKGWLF